MDKQQIIDIVCKNKCLTMDDLRYNLNVGTNFSKDQLKEFLDVKDVLVDEGNSCIEKLPLKPFNSKHVFFVNSEYLQNLQDEYIGFLDRDFMINKKSLISRNVRDMLISRIFSEVEGTLRIENVPTTQKRISEISRNNDLKDLNDIIIKNMLDTMNYVVNECPAFTKENLFKIYNMLSKNCLTDEQQLRPGDYYRYDSVFIGEFKGADVDVIEECMDSLFDFANNKQMIDKYGLMMPYICQYYILYIHPYFDFNGRTARMVSFWLNCLYNLPFAPYFMSEAINENKHEYYNALYNTRVFRNDLTYFLSYIFDTSIKYSLVYKNLEEIKNNLNKSGDDLPSSEWTYLKKILAHNMDGYFSCKMFLEYINSDMTRAGALKILNHLAKYDILEKMSNKKKEIVYKVNQELIVYRYS